MKKWIIGLVLAALCLNLWACGIRETPQSTTAPITTDAPTLPQDLPSEPQPEGPSVRIMNTDLRMQAAWEQLAEEYETATGIDVRIVATENNATLCSVSSPAKLPKNCADLSASAACAQLMNRDLTVVDQQGKILAVANNIEVYGLVYNSTLLAQTAHTREDIRSFAQLTEVVYAITDNADSYGFSAFAQLDANDYFAIQLPALGANSRNLVDLILNTTPATESGSTTNPLWDFVDGKAVFFLAGTRDQDLLSIIGSENMDVLPIYLGSENEENQTLCVAARSYWCVNQDAGSAEDVAATLDFLNFLTTPRADGSLPVDALKIMTPFRQATYVSNIPERVLRADVAQGRVPVVYPYAEQVPQGLTEVLKAYAADPSDNNWEAIRKILEQL